jgi:hypothetical protein
LYFHNVPFDITTSRSTTPGLLNVRLPWCKAKHLQPLTTSPEATVRISGKSQDQNGEITASQKKVEREEGIELLGLDWLQYLKEQVLSCTGLNARSPSKLAIKNQFSCDMLADFIFDWGADLGPPLRWKDNVLISRRANSHLDLYAAAI